MLALASVARMRDMRQTMQFINFDSVHGRLASWLLGELGQTGTWASLAQPDVSSFSSICLGGANCSLKRGPPHHRLGRHIWPSRANTRRLLLILVISH